MMGDYHVLENISYVMGLILRFKLFLSCQVLNLNSEVEKESNQFIIYIIIVIRLNSLLHASYSSLSSKIYIFMEGIKTLT